MRHVEIDVLTRCLTNTENLLGTNGYDVGWCDASTTVQYAPLQWNGKVFTTSHNHYIGYDSASKTFADVLDGLALTITEHGHQPPLMALISQSTSLMVPMVPSPLVIPAAFTFDALSRMSRFRVALRSCALRKSGTGSSVLFGASSRSR